MRYFLWIFLFFSSLTHTILPTQAQGFIFESSNKAKFIGPTNRFVSANDLEKIKSVLKSYGITSAHVDIINAAIDQEQFGFFGYHGARREFLIFQDIIRYGIEEILGIPIREDFHFLRIPGHPDLDIDSVEEFFQAHPNGINDNFPLETLQLLSMNMALYSPYQEQWELSLNYFCHNHNVSTHSYEKVLIPFFLMIGVDPSYIHQAFEIGNAFLTKKSGVLMQFFDFNYTMLDEHAYLAKVRGEKYFPQAPLTELLLNSKQTQFPQSRLVLNHQFAVHPYSTISIKRYTLTDVDTFESYQQSLREYVRTLPYEQSQRDIYRAQLLSLWRDRPLPVESQSRQPDTYDFFSWMYNRKSKHQKQMLISLQITKTLNRASLIREA